LLPAKLVLDGERKENKLQSALESFYSHGLETGKVALVQEENKSVDVCGNSLVMYLELLLLSLTQVK
jgi:hypothetical protein